MDYLKIFDTHAHYDDEAFDEDREKLLNSDSENSLSAPITLSGRHYRVVNIANIGCDIKTSMASVKLAGEQENFYAVVGVIPHHVEELNEKKFDELRILAKENSKVVAIGEIGLDYYYDEPAKELQHEWFRRQILLARELNLPVVIHSREAAKDTYDIMKEAHAEEVGGVVHCYSYSEEMAKEFQKMGFFFGIGGVVTFKNSKKLKRAVESIPLEKIVLETDSPYLTPSPFRGKRNDSRYLPYVVEEIARLKGITPEEVTEKTFENAKGIVLCYNKTIRRLETG